LWQQKKILDIVPNSRWLEIEGAGHVVYIEKPDPFFGTMRRFFEVKTLTFKPLDRVEG